MSKLSEIIVPIRTSLKGFAEGLQQGEDHLRKFGRRMSVIGAEMTTALTLPIVAAGVAAVKSFADIERMQLGLAAVMGSSNAANAEFQKLVETARQPGLGLTQVVDASLTLQSMGTEADEARRIIEGLGKATIFSGKGADEFARAMTQLKDVMAKGKIEAQDTKLLMSAIPALGVAMTKAFGTTSAEVIRSKNSVGQFVEKLIDAAHQLPVTEDMVNSLSNQFQNFTDELKISLAQVGQVIVVNFKLKEVLKSVTASITAGAEAFGRMSPGMQEFTLKGLAALAMLGPLLRILGNLHIVLSVVIMAVKNIAIALRAVLGPIGAVVVLATGFIKILHELREASDNAFVRGLLDALSTGILPMIRGLGKLKDLIFGVKDATGHATDGMKKWAESSPGLAAAIASRKPKKKTEPDKEKTPIQEILDRLKNDVNAANELNKMGMIDDIKEHLRDVYIGAIESLAQEGLKADSSIMKDLFKKAFPDARGVNLLDMLPPLKLPDRIKSLEKFDLSKYIFDKDPNLKDVDEYAKKVIDSLGHSITSLGGKVSDMLANLFSFDMGNGGSSKIAAFIADLGDDFIGIADTIATAVSGIDEIISQSFANREQALDNYYDKERARIEASQMSEEQKQNALLKLDEETEKKRRKLARQKAIRDKLAAIFGATINTALAITKFLAEGNLFGAVAAGALGAIQVGLIAAAPLPLASGGLAYGDTNALIGEYIGARTNPEVVAPLSDLKSMLFDEEQSGGGGEVVFRISGSNLVGVLKNAQRDISISGGYKIG